MIPIKAPRNEYMMTHMINKNDYNILKQQAPQIIKALNEFNLLPINVSLNRTKQYLDVILPNFFEVFINQTNYGSIIYPKEALEEWKNMDWDMSLIEKIKQSYFYKILLSNNNWNKNFIFDNFIEFFHLSNGIPYLIYHYGVIKENKHRAFLLLDRSYLNNLIKYFEKLNDTSDYEEYKDESFSLLDGMWHFVGSYCGLDRTDIDKVMYEKEWAKYKGHPKQYLIDYLKNHKSKWKIEDLK